MSELEFYFTEFLAELQAIEQLAAPFIRTGSESILRGLASDLKNIRDSNSDRTFDWTIPQTSPLRTITSPGSYEKHPRRGSDHVLAEISFIWEIRRLRTKRKENPKFQLAGKASSRIRLCRDAGQERFYEVGLWKMDVADAYSPGCHFHVQVLGERRRKPFPKSISVPRFPIFLATPMGALDFVLGEVFQDEWARRVARDSGEQKMWNRIQALRFTRLSDWHKEIVKNEGGSPWIAIKNSKPSPQLFLET
jgi:hypothetical protein